jgi:hypothetical protein
MMLDKEATSQIVAAVAAGEAKSLLKVEHAILASSSQFSHAHKTTAHTHVPLTEPKGQVGENLRFTSNVWV